MSTSPSRSASVAVPAEPKSASEFLPFPYHLVAGGSAALTTGEGLAQNGLLNWAANGNPAEAAERETQARAQGRQDGLAEARKNFDEQLARERAALGAALAQFQDERKEYFRKVEAEVVQLALSIARKILHREAQIDPLLLAGIVRIALESIEGSTKIVLRIHPRQAAEWRQYLALHPPGTAPEIVEDPALEPGRCVLESSMGTTIIGLDVQLKEIEQGLMDLLAARPGASA